MKALSLRIAFFLQLTTLVLNTQAQTCQPPSSNQIFASNITQNSARLNCNAISGASLYQFQHRRSGTYTWTLGTSSSLNYSNITGLLPNTSYDYQCRVYCTNGWTSFSPIRYFTTNTGGNSCSNPVELACGSNFTGSNNTGNYYYTSYPFQGATNITGPEAYHRLSIAFTALVTINMTGLSQDLDIYLMSTCSNSGGLAVSQNPNASPEQISLNLNPGTYYVIVDGWSGAVSNYSLSVSCTPTTGCPAPTFDESYASDLTCSTARLNCAAGGYTWAWAYRKLNTTTWNYPPTTSIPYTDLSGLDPLTTYEYSSAKRCSNNTWSAWAPIRQFTTPNCVPNNCNNPIIAYCGYTYTGNNSAGSKNFNGYYVNNVYYSETGPEMVYRLNFTTSGPLSLTLGGLTGDLDLFLIKPCNNNAVVAAGLNSGSNNENILINNLAAGTYYIVIDGFQNTTSNYTLKVTCNVPDNNSNDEPCYPATLTPYTYCYTTNATNVGATTTMNPLPPAECNTYNMRDVWFKIPFPASGKMMIQTFPGTLTNALMAVYGGSLCTGLVNYGCWDNYPNGDLMPDVTIMGTPGTYAHIRIWGYNGSTGTFSICAVTLSNLNDGEADVVIGGDQDGLDDRASDSQDGVPASIEAGAAALNVYPNPTDDVLNIETSLPLEAELRVQVFNLAGQLVRETTPVQQPAGNLLKKIDVRTLPPGIYVLKLQAGGVEAIRRFVKS